MVERVRLRPVFAGIRPSSVCKGLRIGCHLDVKLTIHNNGGRLRI